MVTPAIDAFHAHLDVCRQCRDNPFALCVEGYKLLETAAASGLPQFPIVPQEKPTEDDVCNRCGQPQGLGGCDGYCDCES